MSYSELTNSTLLYILVGTGIFYIICLSAVFLQKSWKRCLDLGISSEKIKGIVKSSLIFSVVPSISIVIGLVSLAAVLGVPWPWFRLSVVGSVSYELMAADMVSTAAGFDSVGAMAAANDIRVFGTIMFVMSICILGGLIINLFAVKKIQVGMVNFKKKSGDWGIIVSNCFFLAIVVAFAPSIVAGGAITLLTFATSAVITILQTMLIKKYSINWLENFIMANSLILGMASSVLWTGLLG